MSSGIYCIENTVTGERYVGASCQIKVRWGEHLTLLRNSSHNRYLQASYNKHGEQCFGLQVLEECSKEKLVEKELKWASKLNPSLNASHVSNEGGVLRWRHKHEIKLEASKKAMRQWAEVRDYKAKNSRPSSLPIPR
ncbi:MAG: GIY-YIG nuclease family protein [Nostoc sp. NMS7]|uniref:GIY-YIG nuclease family protein n=1 Tax=Nostoc sp. NMS7 TaxID=2815391 RepID=UPI0025FFCADB|nr:GIY-YIG nuclease family protein [Nostoc sp. NMS7]MBN3951906.1 GIY-YIG nuclease family protein [Nostoc sp. NMS7]